MIWPQCLFSIIKDSFHLGFFRAHTAKMQFSHTIPHYIWCNSPIEYPPWSIKKCTLIKWPQTVFDLIRKGGIFCRCNCQSSPLTGSKNRFSFDQSEKKILTGKSLSEALIFASTNPQYDDRLFIELRVQYMKIASSEHGENTGRKCCVHKLFWMSKQKPICVNKMFFPSSELAIFMYWTCNSKNNRLSYCGLVDARISSFEKDLPIT